MFRNNLKTIFAAPVFLWSSMLNGQDSIVGKLNVEKKMVFESTSSKQDDGQARFQYLKIYKQNDDKNFLDSQILDASTFMVDERMKYNENSMTEFSFTKVEKTDNGKVGFTQPINDLSVFFCDKCKCFALDKCPNDSTEDTMPTLKSNGILNGFPFPPEFSPKADTSHSLYPDNSLGYYHLVIDANADLSRKKNNTLYVKTLKNDTAAYKIAKWFKVNSSLSVFIRNYNFSNLVDIKIAVNGNDYHYEHALNSLYSQVFDSALKGKTGTDSGAKPVASHGDVLLQVIKSNLE